MCQAEDSPHATPYHYIFVCTQKCNVRFALRPGTEEYCVIGLSTRFTHSTALASKATAYPLAYIATKIALQKSLTDLNNAITQAKTTKSNKQTAATHKRNQHYEQAFCALFRIFYNYFVFPTLVEKTSFEPSRN